MHSLKSHDICELTKFQRVQGTSVEELQVKPLSPALVVWTELVALGQKQRAALRDPSGNNWQDPGQRRPTFSVPPESATFICILFTLLINKYKIVWQVFCFYPSFPKKNEIYFFRGGKWNCDVKTGVKGRKPEKAHTAFFNFIHISHLKSLKEKKKKVSSCSGCL